MKAIAHERCFNHTAREAAARCPECGRAFCRECVTEHEDRVICASCLKALMATPPSDKGRLQSVSLFLQFAAGFMITWLLFYYIGQALLLTPSSFHEGNVWGDTPIEPL